MTNELPERCPVCGSTKWCGRPCKLQPKPAQEPAKQRTPDVTKPHVTKTRVTKSDVTKLPDVTKPHVTKTRVTKSDVTKLPRGAGRPCLGSKPMTTAERVRKWRARHVDA